MCAIGPGQPLPQPEDAGVEPGVYGGLLEPHRRAFADPDAWWTSATMPLSHLSVIADA